MNQFQHRWGAHILSVCRRIERVKTDKREVMLLIRRSPVRGVTEEQLGILSQYSAKAAFEVFGSTADNRLGRRYSHIPARERDSEGGVANCPELVTAISDSGHDLAGAGWSYTPLKSQMLFGKKGFAALEEAALDRRRLAEITGELPFVTAVGSAELTADEYSIFDLFSALGGQYLCPLYEFSDEKAELLVKFSLRLDRAPDMLKGCVIAVSGVNTLQPLLAVLTKHGYSVTLPSALLDRSPMSDVSEKNPCFEAAADMLRRGHALLRRDNTLRLDSAISKAEVYAMLTPREVMADYFRSRVFGCEPELDVNRQSEKDFFSSPCRATTSGLFYACANGWDTRSKHNDMTTADFARLLDTVAAGRDVSWSPDRNDRLVRADVINTLYELTK